MNNVNTLPLNLCTVALGCWFNIGESVLMLLYKCLHNTSKPLVMHNWCIGIVYLSIYNGLQGLDNDTQFNVVSPYYYSEVKLISA